MAGNAPSPSTGFAVKSTHRTLGPGKAPSSLRIYCAMTASSDMEEWLVPIDLGNGAKIYFHPNGWKQENGSGQTFNVEGFLVSSTSTVYPLPCSVLLYINDRDHSGHVNIEVATP